MWTFKRVTVDGNNKIEFDAQTQNELDILRAQEMVTNEEIRDLQFLIIDIITGKEGNA